MHTKQGTGGVRRNSTLGGGIRPRDAAMAWVGLTQRWPTRRHGSLGWGSTGVGGRGGKGGVGRAAGGGTRHLGRRPKREHGTGRRAGGGQTGMGIGRKNGQRRPCSLRADTQNPANFLGVRAGFNFWRFWRFCFTNLEGEAGMCFFGGGSKKNASP